MPVPAAERRKARVKAPHYATISLSLDTTKYRARRPEERDNNIAYLPDRLLCGEEVAADALEHYGLRVTVRAALKPEII
jgi:hypothetical protein